MTQLSQPNEPVLLTREIKARYKIGDRSIRKLIQDGTFRAKLVGSGKSRKYLVVAEDVERWFRSGLAPDKPVETSPSPTSEMFGLATPHDREIIPRSSIAFMTDSERREINEREASGELVEAMIGGHPCLVSANRQ